MFDSVNNTRPLLEILKTFTRPPIIHNGVIGGCDYRANVKIARLYLTFTEPIIAYHSCQANEAVALLNRHLIITKVTDEHTAIAKRCFSRYCQLHPPRELIPYTIQQVLNSKRGSKRKTYKRAYLKYNMRGLIRRDYEINMFVKYERMSIRDPFKPPRAIQARGPVFNLVLQQYILPYAKYLIRDDTLQHRYVTKGMDGYAVASLLHRGWSTFRRPVAKLLDHDRFDSRANRDWTVPMHEYVNMHYRHTKCAEMLSHLGQSKCVSLHGLVYHADDTVFSGDVTTGDGNSTINKALITDYTDGIDCFVVLNGDDSVIMLEFDDLEELDRRDLQQYGFHTKSSTVYEFNDIEYCQCKPVKTINGWLMVRDPMRVMSRSTVCLQPYSEKYLLSWFASVGDCEMSCNQGVPILYAFSQYLRRASNKLITLTDDIRFHRIVGDYSTIITDETRISFYMSFSYHPSLQVQLEEYFKTLSWDYRHRVLEFPTSQLLTVP